MGELTPVYEIDGRPIGWGSQSGAGAGPVTKRLQVRIVNAIEYVASLSSLSCYFFLGLVVSIADCCKTCIVNVFVRKYTAPFPTEKVMAFLCLTFQRGINNSDRKWVLAIHYRRCYLRCGKI